MLKPFLVGTLALTLACGEARTDSGAGGRGGNAGGQSGMPGAAADSGNGGGMAGRAGAAGSGGSAGTAQPGDDSSFVPEGLRATELNAEGGLTLIALTLVPGVRGPELYAAVRNEGRTPACEAGMTINFKDEADQIIATAAGTLLSGRHYRLDGGTGVVISCVAPDQVAMTAMTELPENVVIEALGSLEYAFPAFTVGDIVAVEGLGVSDVQTVMTASGNAFTGSVTNEFSEALSNPKVTVFPLNRVGRPLAVAISGMLPNLGAGERADFRTNSFQRSGTGYAAFATATYPF